MLFKWLPSFHKGRSVSGFELDNCIKDLSYLSSLGFILIDSSHSPNLDFFGSEIHERRLKT
jgi:hypothetical protein